MCTKQRFSIGLQFNRVRKHSTKLLTIIDILKTYNNQNELVKLRYVCTYETLGQTLTDSDVTDVEIARSTFQPA